MKQTMWLSRYALSGGIREVEVNTTNLEGYIIPLGFCTSFKVGTDLHITREGAIAVAEKAKAAKIKSLRKQLANMEAMDFR